jgi:hypothetical protein
MPYSLGFILENDRKRHLMAKPNYAFAKRQRDLAKKQKKEEKRLKKAGPQDGQPQDGQPPVEGENNTEVKPAGEA